jgi:hypothetical protein
MKYASLILLFLSILGFTCRAEAYLLPKHEISKTQMAMHAEQVLASFQSQMDEVMGSVRPGKLDEHERNKKIRLSRKERAVIERYRELQIPIRFWKYIVDLKTSLIELLDVKSEKAIWEADLLAKLIIDAVYKISQEYRVDFTALFRNFEINTGDNKKGFCYHYVTDILDILTQHTWKYFSLHWGEANAKTWLENNALVITAKRKPFDSGIVFDAWRTGGKPLWKGVKEDSFQWKEAPTMLYE